MTSKSDMHELAILMHLTDKFGTDPGMAILFKAMRSGQVRSGHDKKYVPCRNAPTNHEHRYQSAGAEPFRIRCSWEGCDDIRKGSALSWFATLVTRGMVVGAALQPPKRTDLRKVSFAPQTSG